MPILFERLPPGQFCLLHRANRNDPVLPLASRAAYVTRSEPPTHQAQGVASISVQRFRRFYTDAVYVMIRCRLCPFVDSVLHSAELTHIMKSSCSTTHRGVFEVIVHTLDCRILSAISSANLSLQLLRPLIGICCRRSFKKERGCSTHGIHSVPVHQQISCNMCTKAALRSSYPVPSPILLTSSPAK